MTINAAPGLVEGTGGNCNSNREGTDLDLQHNGQRPQQDSHCIYRRGVWLYRKAGWRGVLPLPPVAKTPPPKGYTGYDGQWPTNEQIDEWIAKNPSDRNLAIRVEYGIIGIDVDAYDLETGGQTLKEAESCWGPLPSTYRSSARIHDDVSGVRLFRVPVGVFFRSVIEFKELGLGDIEIIQPHHRFVTAWPSIHPKNGQRYRWIGPDGLLLPEGHVPRVEDLPELPQEWVDTLSKDAVRHAVFDGSAPNRPRYRDGLVDEDLYQRLTHLADNGVPDVVVDARLRKALLELTGGAGSRYDHTRDNVAAPMRMHASDRVGAPRALAELFTAYVLEVVDTRPRQVAEAEFCRFTAGAALLIAATPAGDPWRTLEMGGPGTVTDGVQDGAGVPEQGLSWGRVDLADLLQGVREPLVPTLFERSDAHCLLYPGMVHSFHGEPESGKSLIVQAECVRLINQHHDVLYIDFDSDERSVVDRLLEFGADPRLVEKHFDYRHPDTKPDTPEERQAWHEMLSGPYVLAVIDGVTDALGVFGHSSIDNDDVARWIRTVPKVIAAKTGAAVVLIDHVVKDSSNRNRFAIGGQAKMAGLTGAAYTVDVIAPLGRGMRGEVVLRIAKDRPGEVRRNCGSFKNRDRTQEAARIIVDSTTDPPTMTIGPPGTRCEDGTGGPQAFRPTALMQRVSEVIEQQAGKLTKTQAVITAGGKKQSALLAFDLLDGEGHLTNERGRSGHPVYTVVKPYREKDDPLSDRYVDSGNSVTSESLVPGSRFL